MLSIPDSCCHKRARNVGLSLEVHYHCNTSIVLLNERENSKFVKHSASVFPPLVVCLESIENWQIIWRISNQ